MKYLIYVKQNMAIILGAIDAVRSHRVATVNYVHGLGCEMGYLGLLFHVFF